MLNIIRPILLRPVADRATQTGRHEGLQRDIFRMEDVIQETVRDVSGL